MCYQNTFRDPQVLWEKAVKSTAPQSTGLEPTIIVIFGITGDLAQRKLLPALYHLVKDGLLHEKTILVGTSRRKITADEVLEKIKPCILDEDGACDDKILKQLGNMFSIQTMDATDDADYAKLLTHLNDLEDKHGVCMNRLFYLSIPPQIFAPIVRHLGEQKLNGSCQHGVAVTRLLVEKPFGYDLASAKELIHETGKHFDEKQVFRIDHYLAKETAQNILTFRFQNPLFEAVWSKENIRSIDVVANEKIDIEGRASFYDHVGALRDLIQSHLLQLMALVTMERPVRMSSDSIHHAKLELFNNVQTVPADKISERVVRAQYDGFRSEVENPNSTTETFARVQLFIENNRWQGVPITLQTGKALAKKETSITLTFGEKDSDQTNVFTFNIQPDEGIGIKLLVKRPGFERELDVAAMDFSYERTYDEQGHPDAYERVLVDAVRGDHTLFATSDEILATWRIVEPIIQAWSQNDTDLKTYKKGSAGPTV
jgi:glucose-6-phosphate 1-dehydrogenase